MGPKMFLYLAVNMFTSALKLNILTWKSHFLGPLKWPLEELEIYGVFRGFGGGLFFFSSLSTKPLIAAVVCRLWHFICGILIPQLKLYSLPGALFSSESGCILSEGFVCVHNHFNFRKSSRGGMTLNLCHADPAEQSLIIYQRVFSVSHLLHLKKSTLHYWGCFSMQNIGSLTTCFT